MAEEKQKEEIVTEETDALDGSVGPEDVNETSVDAGEDSSGGEEEINADEAIETDEATQPETEDTAEQLAQAQQEAAEFKDNWQRTAAELANFRRRQEEQMKLQRDRIKTEVLEGVISALDDLDLGFQNLPQEIDGQVLGWVEGFRLVQRKLNKILDDQNVMPVDTAGKFDPTVHEAVTYEESDEHETDDIIAELRKGYQIGSRVIRPALVRVAR